MFLSIISFIVVFTIIAFVHELGHFIVAKRSGMYVPECGLGFGPRIWSFKKGETVYAINLIPILAYVSIAGMDESKEADPEIPENRKYFSKPPLTRLKMAFMGPMFNIFLAYIISSFLFGIIGIPGPLSRYIDQVQPNSIAAKAGLKSGDELIALNSVIITKIEGAIKTIHESGDKELTLKIKRDGRLLTIKAVPKYNPRLKVALLGFSPRPTYIKINPLQAIYYGAQQTAGMIVLMFVILGQLIGGAISVKELAGPVGIAQITGKYASTGIISLAQFLAFLNVNIGVLNLLPLPALDGGHIVFAAIEAITKKKVSEEAQKRIHQWGLIALLALMALVTLNDILRILQPR